MITHPQTGTNVQEIADGIYRINTPMDLPDGQGFSFNQYLLVDDQPLLWHTGPRRMFPLVSEAIAAVMERPSAGIVELAGQAIGRAAPGNSTSTSTWWWTMSRCCSTADCARCFRWCARRSPRSCPSSGCAGSASRTPRPTSAAR